MTNLEQLAAEMELLPERRETLARELERLRRLESECRRHWRRLPHQVQTALRREAPVYELDPPPPTHSSARLF
jgi:hypothetical protein